MPRPTAPVRLSAENAAWEFHVTGKAVRRGLKQLGIVPDGTGKYSIYEIAQAIYSNNGLEQKGEAARWESKIADAELKKLKLKAETKELIPADKLRKEWDDAVTMLFTRIRHHRTLSETEKRQLIAGIEADFEKRFK